MIPANFVVSGIIDLVIREVVFQRIGTVAFSESPAML